MKKIGKIFVTIALAFICIFICSDKVFAECTYYKDGPSLKAGKIHNGPVYNLTSASTPATGANTRFWSKEYGFLSMGFTSSTNENQRKLYISLMEQDIIFNDDDEVRTLVGTFNNRQLVSIVYDTLLIPGRIEAENDKTSELYIRTKMSRLGGDTSDSTGVFFKYQLCQEWLWWG